MTMIVRSFFQEQKSDSNQQRGWRSNATMSDRDLNLRRPQAKRDRKFELSIQWRARSSPT